jgi:hypothetical protein
MSIKRVTLLISKVFFISLIIILLSITLVLLSSYSSGILSQVFSGLFFFLLCVVIGPIVGLGLAFGYFCCAPTYFIIIELVCFCILVFLFYFCYKRRNLFINKISLVLITLMWGVIGFFCLGSVY